MENIDSDGTPAKAQGTPWRRVRLTIVGVDRARQAEASTTAPGGTQLAEGAPVAELSRYAVPY